MTAWWEEVRSALAARVAWPSARPSPDRGPPFPRAHASPPSGRTQWGLHHLPDMTVQAGLCFLMVMRCVTRARAVAALVLVACCWGRVLCQPVLCGLQNACSGVAKADGGPVRLSKAAAVPIIVAACAGPRQNAI